MGNWEKKLNYLKEYIRRQKNTNVPAEYVNEHGFKLGHWVTMQRYEFSKKNLSKTRQAALEQLPGWFWDKREAKWHIGFEHLRAYAQKHGHCKVAQFYRSEDGFGLGFWYNVQQEAYSSNALSADKQQALESLPGWIWRIKKIRPKTNKGEKRIAPTMPWAKKLKCLQDYVKRFSHAQVPRHYVLKNGFNLGAWVFTQRYYYKKGMLASTRQQALENIPGWSWEGKLYTADRESKVWLKNLGQIKQYVRQQGHSEIPAKFVTKDGYRLGSWISYIKRRKEKGKLTSAQIEVLEKFPGWIWKTNKTGLADRRWEKSYRLLIAYIQREGHARIPTRYETEEGYCLGSWVQRQRILYRKGQLPGDKLRMFEKLPGWVWDVWDDCWTRGYQQLYEYVKHYKTSRVLKGYVTNDGYNLGYWVERQRVDYRKGIRLSPVQRKKLEQLPDWIRNIR